MKTYTRCTKVIAALLILSAAFASPTRASVLSGCVAPEDAGVTHLVGWVDVGVMLGMADLEPPASLQVTDPNGGVIELSPAPIMMGNPPLLVISLFALPLAIVVSVIVLVRAIRPSLLNSSRQPAAR